jgi:hypothetical protein
VGEFDPGFLGGRLELFDPALNFSVIDFHWYVSYLQVICK